MTPSTEEPVSAGAGRGSGFPGLVSAVAVVAGAAVLFGVASPAQLSAPGVRGAVETLIASSAILGAAILLVTFRRRREHGDLLLLIAFAAVGATDFVFLVLPAIAGARLTGSGLVLQMACDAWAALAFAAAAFARSGRLARGELGRSPLVAGVAMATMALASLVGLVVAESVLGVGAAASHSVRLGAAIFASSVFLVAGVAFLRRPERDSHALASAAFLLVAARLQYLGLPVAHPEWVTVREVLRLGAYALLLAVALGRYAHLRREVATAALAVERERIARDLHDGLAQDLALIAVQSQELSRQLGDEHPLTIAARRAVAASRGVIVDLSASTAASTELALHQVADELTVRFGVDIDVRMVDDPQRPAQNDLDATQREEVVRIAREAIVNAARHGGARHVELALDRTRDQARLRVSDDGRGLPHAPSQRRGGYGLQMMRARSAALGGSLVMRGRTQGGAELEVTFPCRRVAAG